MKAKHYQYRSSQDQILKSYTILVWVKHISPSQDLHPDLKAKHILVLRQYFREVSCSKLGSNNIYCNSQCLKEIKN